MTITITITAETGQEARHKMADFLGVAVLQVADAVRTPAPDPLDSPYIKANGEVMTLGEATRAEAKGNVEPTGVAEMHKAEAAAEQAVRAKRTRKPKAEEPQIRTNPENRVEPEAVDDEATAEQDEADEQAEVEATRAPETPVTIDDLKKAVGDYLNAFRTDMNADRSKPGSGFLETQEDGPKIFKSVLGDPPPGSAWTFPAVAELPQEKLAAVVNAWKNAVAEATTSKKRFGT